MAEATSIVFTPIEMSGGYKIGYVTATISSDETITLSDHEYAIDTIKGILSCHVAATGVVKLCSYATNVLTLETAAETDISLVVTFLYE